MNTINSVLNNFNSIVDYMSQCINNKFIRIQKACKYLDPERSYGVQLIDKSGKLVVHSFNLCYTGEKWVAEYLYEGTNCCNTLPCDNYIDSIIGMTTAEVASLFSRSYIALIVDKTTGYEVITEIKL